MRRQSTLYAPEAHKLFWQILHPGETLLTISFTHLSNRYLLNATNVPGTGGKVLGKVM